MRLCDWCLLGMWLSIRKTLIVGSWFSNRLVNSLLIAGNSQFNWDNQQLDRNFFNIYNMNKDTKDSLVKIAKDVAVLAATSLASMAVKLIFKKRFDI